MENLKESPSGVTGASMHPIVMASVPVRPYYSDEHCVIYHADCRKVLPWLEKFDLVLTDPPYGIGIAANPVRQKHEKQDWDNVCPPRYLVEMAIEAGKYAIVWGGNYFGLPASRKFLVWDKQQPEDFSLAMVEQAWCSWDGNAKTYTKRVIGYTKVHPTQKPEGLMRWCIAQTPEPVQTIVDPFMGSGTTLVAARLEGKFSVGIELNEKYCEAAADRFRQGLLF